MENGFFYVDNPSRLRYTPSRVNPFSAGFLFPGRA